MSWKKACFIYCLALAVTMLANIEKVSVWTDDHFADGWASPVTRHVRQVRNFCRETGLTGYTRKLDCLLAPYFDETYKNSLACRDEPTTEKAEESLRDRLDPNQPILKGDAPVDTVSLLAALSPPRPPLSQPEDDAGGTESAPSLTRQDPTSQSLVAGKGLSPRKILVVGDSLAIGLSLSLRRSVVDLADVELIEEGKVSSGLANPKYYDWEKALRVFVDKYAPDLVVIMMGANDAKYINLNEKPRPAGSTNKTWPEVFSMRVENFLSALQAKNIRNYWIGLPIMGDAPYARQAQVMNDIVKEECGKFSSSRYLDTWNLLTDDQGNYATFLPNEKGVKIKVRANDKVHFTVAGGDILAQFLLGAVGKDVELRPKTPGAPNAAAKAP
jgi:hypothetical protein